MTSARGRVGDKWESRGVVSVIGVANGEEKGNEELERKRETGLWRRKGREEWKRRSAANIERGG